MKVAGKTFLVTGAASGIGKELTLLLLEKGAKVAAADMHEEALAELAKQVGQPKNLSTHVVNVTDRKAVESLPDAVAKALGNIDGLINNAGIIQPFVKVNDLNYDAIERVMNVNFYGTLNMTKAFLPHLLKRPEAHVVNVSSMGGFLPVPGQSVYGASKAAVKLLTEGLYAELSGTPVHVSVVFPGATATNITANSGLAEPTQADTKDQPKFQMQTARQAAEIIVHGIEKDQYQIFVGKDSKMMNLLYRLAPRFATDLITKQMKSLLPK